MKGQNQKKINPLRPSALLFSKEREKISSSVTMKGNKKTHQLCGVTAFSFHLMRILVNCVRCHNTRSDGLISSQITPLGVCLVQATNHEDWNGQCPENTQKTSQRPFLQQALLEADPSFSLRKKTEFKIKFVHLSGSPL